MRRVALIVLLSIAVAAAADKDKRFAPKAAETYPGHQTFNKITIAAVPYTSDDQAKSAFDKVRPYKYGILPILVVIKNDTGKALRLNLHTELVDVQDHSLDSMPPRDVVLFDGAANRTYAIPRPSINPIPLPHKEKKGPLDTWEIEGLAFTAKLVPDGESVFGFVYFDSALRPDSHLYVSGIDDAASGKEYLPFEVPFEDQKP
jgi:hypothetical protein